MNRQGYLTRYSNTNGCNLLKKKVFRRKKSCHPSGQETNRLVDGQEYQAGPMMSCVWQYRLLGVVKTSLPNSQTNQHPNEYGDSLS
jgi:hypothetical protein